jgi:hypothetical protein
VTAAQPTSGITVVAAPTATRKEQMGHRPDEPQSPQIAPE